MDVIDPSLVKIGSLTAEILMTLSSRWMVVVVVVVVGGGDGVKSFSCQTQLLLC